MAVLTRVERPAAPDAEAAGEHRIAVGNLGVEPSGDARVAEDLFHEAFSRDKRLVIQHVPGLQVEQLMRPKSATPSPAGKELIAKIGEIAAWLAHEDSGDDSEFSDIIVDPTPVKRSPKASFNSDNQRVDDLIERALKLRVPAENIPERKRSQEEEDKATREQQVTALREEHRELRLHAAFLFELGVVSNKRDDAERVMATDGVRPHGTRSEGVSKEPTRRAV